MNKNRQAISTNLHSPITPAPDWQDGPPYIIAVEAVVGPLIDISFIVAFAQRFFAR